MSDFMTLKTQAGALSDPELHERLRLARPIRFDLLLEKYRDRKFVDHEPPLPYMLQILWDYVFTRMAADVERREGEDFVRIETDTRTLTATLQEYFGWRSGGERSIEIPRPAWVRNALHALIKFGLCSRGTAKDTYVVRYKRTRRDTLKYFGQRVWKNGGSLEPEAPKPLLDALQPSQSGDQER